MVKHLHRVCRGGTWAVAAGAVHSQRAWPSSTPPLLRPGALALCRADFAATRRGRAGRGLPNLGQAAGFTQSSSSLFPPYTQRPLPIGWAVWEGFCGSVAWRPQQPPASVTALTRENNTNWRPPTNSQRNCPHPEQKKKTSWRPPTLTLAPLPRTPATMEEWLSASLTIRQPFPASSCSGREERQPLPFSFYSPFNA